MATIKDVAAMAGISYTTVSHVLNKTRPVSEPVRLKVEQAIAHLEYVPSAVARSLKAKTTATIGLLVANSLNPYFAELARGIEDYCERNNYCVILCNCDDDPVKQRNYLRVLLEKRVDGLVVASSTGDLGMASGLVGVRTPMVIVDRSFEGVEADLVCIDHELGAYLATRHLLDLGHRAIACIGGPAATRVAQLRMAGYRRALLEAGITPQGQWMVESDFSSVGGYNAAVGLLQHNPPSAIFACNDMMGIGVLRAAAERNIRVPQQLSVIGFDDVQMSRYVYPSLTTVGQSILQLGEIAAQLLLRRIAVPGRAVEQRIVKPDIVLRESTRAYAQAPLKSPLQSLDECRYMQANVVVAGSLNMDLVTRTERLPRPGETVFGQSFTTVHGGKGANQAVAASRLGARVAMLGCVGGDAYGVQLRDGLLADRVDCVAVRTVPDCASGVALITVDACSQNTIVVVPGANGCLAAEDIRAFDHVLQGAQVLVCQLEVPMETVGCVLARGRELGKVVILNPAPVSAPLPGHWYGAIDYLIPNESEAWALSGVPVDSLESAGRAARRLVELGAGKVIVTLGALGALFVSAHRVMHFTAPKVEAVDATAAGDTFVGGFSAALAAGMEEDDAIRFAQVAAALSVTRAGAQPSIPLLRDVQGFKAP